MTKAWKMFLFGVSLVIVGCWILRLYFTSTSSSTSINITIREENVIPFTFFVGVGYAHDLVSERMLGVGDSVILTVGTGEITFEGKTYRYAFCYILCTLKGPGVGPGPAPPRLDFYLLEFFCNNSDVCKLLRRYGLPASYAEVAYNNIQVRETCKIKFVMAPKSREPLLQLSVIAEAGNRTPELGTPALRYYYANNRNLTVIDLSDPVAYKSTWSGAKANMTVNEGSTIWKYIGQVSYITEKAIPCTFPYRQFSSRIQQLTTG